LGECAAGRICLINRTYDDKAINVLRSGGHAADALKAIDGVVLRNRSLRFASLEGISLFASDLTNSDLRKANLAGANLQGAQLRWARLQDAELSVARLMFAQLWGAELQGAHLYMTQLQGADLSAARLQGADLSGAQLQGANLLSAQLQGARLTGAQLEAAFMHDARLEGANLFWARLQGADLSQAWLQGADLSQARLQGALLGGAQLQGADLIRARLWRASFDAKTDLGLADLRDADFTTKLTEEDMKGFSAALDAIRDDPKYAATTDFIALGSQMAERISGRVFGAEQLTNQLLFTASAEQQVLVNEPKNPMFEKIPTEWLIGSPTPSYTSALIALLADQLAPRASAIASNIASRSEGKIGKTTDDKSRSLYETIVCRLLENARADKVTLSRLEKESASRALENQKAECEAAIRPLPPLQGVQMVTDVISEPQ
jgi:uncharacterized protein YjbI with pentapeptide repeats